MKKIVLVFGFLLMSFVGFGQRTYRTIFNFECYQEDEYQGETFFGLPRLALTPEEEKLFYRNATDFGLEDYHVLSDDVAKHLDNILRDVFNITKYKIVPGNHDNLEEWLPLADGGEYEILQFFNTEMGIRIKVSDLKWFSEFCEIKQSSLPPKEKSERLKNFFADKKVFLLFFKRKSNDNIFYIVVK